MLLTAVMSPVLKSYCETKENLKEINFNFGSTIHEMSRTDRQAAKR